MVEYFKVKEDVTVFDGEKSYGKVAKIMRTPRLVPKNATKKQIKKCYTSYLPYTKDTVYDIAEFNVFYEIKWDVQGKIDYVSSNMINKLEFTEVRQTRKRKTILHNKDIIRNQKPTNTTRYTRKSSTQNSRNQKQQKPTNTTRSTRQSTRVKKTETKRKRQNSLTSESDYTPTKKPQKKKKKPKSNGKQKKPSKNQSKSTQKNYNEFTRTVENLRCDRTIIRTLNKTLKDQNENHMFSKSEIKQSINYCVRQASEITVIGNILQSLYMMEYADDTEHISHLLNNNQFFEVLNQVASVKGTNKESSFQHTEMNVGELNNTRSLFNQLLKLRNKHIDPIFEEHKIQCPSRKDIAALINQDSKVKSSNLKNFYWMNCYKFQRNSLREFLSSIYKQQTNMTHSEIRKKRREKRHLNTVKRKKRRMKKGKQSSKNKRRKKKGKTSGGRRTSSKNISKKKKEENRKNFHEKMKRMEGNNTNTSTHNTNFTFSKEDNDLYKGNWSNRKKSTKFNLLLLQCLRLVNNNQRIPNDIRARGNNGERIMKKIEEHRSYLQRFISNPGTSNNDGDDISESDSESDDNSSDSESDTSNNNPIHPILPKWDKIIPRVTRYELKRKISKGKDTWENFRQLIRYFKFLNCSPPCPQHGGKAYFIYINRTSLKDIIRVTLRDKEIDKKQRASLINDTQPSEIFNLPKKNVAGRRMFSDTLLSNGYQGNMIYLYKSNNNVIKQQEISDQTHNEFLQFKQQTMNNKKNSVENRFCPSNTTLFDELVPREYIHWENVVFPDKSYPLNHYRKDEIIYDDEGIPFCCHKTNDSVSNDDSPNSNNRNEKDHDGNQDHSECDASTPKSKVKNKPTRKFGISNDPGINNLLSMYKDYPPLPTVDEDQPTLSKKQQCKRNFCLYQEKDRSSSYVLTNKRYRHMQCIKQYDHQIKLNIASDKNEDYTDIFLLNQGTSSKTWDMTEYMTYRSRILLNWKRYFDFMFLPYHRKYRFKRYKKHQETISQVTKEIVGHKQTEEVFIIWGNGKFKHTYHNHPPASNKSLRKGISNTIPVITASEYKTTKLSCCCHSPTEYPTYGNRKLFNLLKCKACGKVRGRDYNAAKNIFYRFKMSVNNNHTGPFTYIPRESGGEGNNNQQE